MIYLGHKERWLPEGPYTKDKSDPLGLKPDVVSTSDVLDASLETTKMAVDIGVGDQTAVCKFSVVNDARKFDVQPWNGIFHCGD